jgi:hypothetical protein
MSGWLYDYSLTCQPVDFSTSPKAMRVCEIIFFSKLKELFLFFKFQDGLRLLSVLHFKIH